MNRTRIRIFLLGTSIAIGTVAGLAPSAGAYDLSRAPREGETVQPPVVVNPGIDPCDLVGCARDKPVIDNPNIDPCDLVPEACTPGKPGKPGTPSANPDAPVRATVAFTG